MPFPIHGCSNVAVPSWHCCRPLLQCRRQFGVYSDAADDLSSPNLRSATKASRSDIR